MFFCSVVQNSLVILSVIGCSIICVGWTDSVIISISIHYSPNLVWFFIIFRIGFQKASALNCSISTNLLLELSSLENHSLLKQIDMGSYCLSTSYCYLYKQIVTLKICYWLFPESHVLTKCFKLSGKTFSFAYFFTNFLQILLNYFSL